MNILLQKQPALVRKSLICSECVVMKGCWSDICNVYYGSQAGHQ